jgi:hypothetical protein
MMRGTSIPVVIPLGETGKLESKMNDTNLNQPFMLKYLVKLSRTYPAALTESQSEVV